MKAVFLAALLGASVVSAIAPLGEQEYQTQFVEFAQQHGKTYDTAELFHRFNVFKSNVEHIRTVNAKNLSYQLGMNQFGDLTADEFKAQIGGCFRGSRSNRIPAEAPKLIRVPNPVDWTAKGKIQNVKDQAQCGSCWAFSAIGAVEGAWAIAKGELLDLSEQQLVDCSGSEGNMGCNGGLMTYAFQYLIKNNGSCATSEYPYRARDMKCNPSCKRVAQISAFEDVKENDENALGDALQKGPVSVAIEADKTVFQFYKSGILDDPRCGTDLDHGVLLTGYGADSSNGYWMVKNSWGRSWGNAGYVWMRAFKNTCGIAQMNTYPVV